MSPRRRDSGGPAPEERPPGPVPPAAGGDGRRRVVIEHVRPEIDGGRFRAKRIQGDTVEVEADVFVDGHETVACVVRYARPGEQRWSEVPMRSLGRDRWRGEFVVDRLGRYRYTVEGWTEPFLTWRRELQHRLEAGQDVSVDLLIGAELVRGAAARASGDAARRLTEAAAALAEDAEPAVRCDVALDPELAALVAGHPDRRFATRFPRELEIQVDRSRARFGAWYELFPRSCADQAGRHGTLADCARRLEYVAAMGFDVVYLPPIHPIGRSFRKGKNNSVDPAPDDVGSPWAIGSAEGGHTAIHPDLGTMEDFARLMRRAGELGLELALDVAFQCSPDHPWVTRHPEWFRHRPDGSIQYAENPPKKYQDIYPLDFDTEAWEELWEELARVIEFWVDQGVRIFRVDNPHTKAFRFWEWAIERIQARHPDVIFLAEAFTRPPVMYFLAKLGFTQSYTYFAWRNTKDQLTDYFTELTRTNVREHFRPNLWPNTPDILTEYLQFGGRAAFMIRLVLAATLGASYGIYGPAFELLEHTPLAPGSEEYRDSEKYQIRTWNLDHPWSLRDFITRINRIRRENPALHGDWSLRFHRTDNPMLLCYSKATADGSSVVVVVVNLDPAHAQSGWVELDLPSLGFTAEDAYQVHDLLGDGRFLWQGTRNYVELVPDRLPAHLFRLRRKVRTERDFDYYS